MEITPVNQQDLHLAKLCAIAYSQSPIALYKQLGYRAAPLHQSGAANETYALIKSGGVIVVCAGSSGLADWAKYNLLVAPKYSPTIAANVHYGIWEASRELIRSIEAICTIALPTSLTIIGHSLGGGMATLLGLAIARWKPSIVSFGAPRVLTRTNTLEINHCRVVHYLDPVPRLPPRAIGWQHQGLPIVIGRDGEVRVGDKAWEEAKNITGVFDIRHFVDRLRNHFDYGPDLLALAPKVKEE
jgi:pimeloyl-ACP methyl ester carboxylesterase